MFFITINLHSLGSGSPGSGKDEIYFHPQAPANKILFLSRIFRSLFPSGRSDRSIEQDAPWQILNLYSNTFIFPKLLSLSSLVLLLFILFFLLAKFFRRKLFVHVHLSAAELYAINHSEVFEIRLIVMLLVCESV